MCGIIGTTNLQLPEAEFEQALRYIKHRGPDNTGSLKNEQVYFGHTRLAILDLDERSNQPFFYEHEGRKYLISFNGEIYNYLQLKEDLIAAGYRFRTNSDTEVICASYDRYGMECFDRFEGMWAVALQTGQELILSRDRVGKKPLYIGFDERSQLSFSSSVRAVAGLTAQHDIDAQAVELYFAYGFIPGSFSINKNISRVLPGEILRYALTGGKAELREKRQSVFRPEKSQYRLPFRKLFRNTVKKRLISDVPVTALMSGGVDSTIVTAEMKGLQPSSEAYFVDFEDKQFSENKWATYLSNRNSVKLNRILLSAGKLEDAFDDYYTVYEEPFADYSGIPSIAIFKETARKYKVVLTGDGGDELFFGYPHYTKKLVLYKFAWLLKLVGKVKKLPANVERILSAGKHRFESSYLSNHGIVTPFAQKIVDEAFNKHVSGNRSFARALAAYDRDFYNWPEKYLVKVDRASMFAGIEVRSPFLDEHLVAKTNRIPVVSLFTPFNKKLFLKLTYYRFFGLKYLAATKRGFTPPIQTLRDKFFTEAEFEDLKTYLTQAFPAVGAQSRLLRYSDLKKDNILFDRFFFFNEWRKKAVSANPSFTSPGTFVNEEQ